MKKLLFGILTICIISCTKTVEKQDSISNLAYSQNQSSPIAGRGNAEKFPISIMWYHVFQSFIRDCVPGTWYCWQIGSPVDNKSYIQIDEKNELITFGIDNSDSSRYNSQFMVESNFKFPQDTLNTDLTYAASGSRNMIYVKKGLYHFDIIDNVITVTVPYFIVR
jgi:hypothetical protein